MSAHFPSPVPADLAALNDQVQRMSGTLTCDFVNGRVGQRYNTYEHRTRVLRQLTARRDRVRDAGVGPAVLA
jgi:hypothetical protein